MSTAATHARRLALCMAIAVVIVGLVRPAAAESWTPFGGDRWIWLDTDSVNISGDVVSYTVAHSTAENVPPGPDAYRGRQSVNCRTLTASNASDSWPLTSNSFIVVRYCPKREAAKPALAPAKPAPAAAPKGQGDIKTCVTYSPDDKLRIAACTRIIESKNPGIADLVAAHTQRCVARFFAKEKVDDALVDCDRAVTLDPKNFDAVHWRAAVKNSAGRYDDAIADFTAAIALNPKAPGPHYNRAQAYLRKKDLQKAISDLTANRNLTPDGDESFFRMTLCWARASLNMELETALSDCESAVRLAPKNSYAYERRGLVRLRMNDLKEARADADKALALDKKNARALYLRALVSAREGKTMASYGDYAAATKTQEGIAKDYDDIGLKLIVQAENAPFCPALTALIKASGERAASKAKADVAMPGATYCAAIDSGYLCRWLTGVAQAPARQAAMAAAGAACLSGYARKDSADKFGPRTEFAQGKTKITIATTYDLKASAVDGAAVAVAIGK